MTTTHLEPGDFVVFLTPKGLLYRTKKSPFKMVWVFEEDPVGTESTFPSDAVLTVMKASDGKHLGFRSAAAEGKVLQAATSLILFDNHNFGSWEQWTLTEDSSKICHLVNKAFPTVQLQVMIKKVLVVSTTLVSTIDDAHVQEKKVEELSETVKVLEASKSTLETELEGLKNSLGKANEEIETSKAALEEMKKMEEKIMNLDKEKAALESEMKEITEKKNLAEETEKLATEKMIKIVEEMKAFAAKAKEEREEAVARVMADMEKEKEEAIEHVKEEEEEKVKEGEENRVKTVAEMEVVLKEREVAVRREAEEEGEKKIAAMKEKVEEESAKKMEERVSEMKREMEEQYAEMLKTEVASVRLEMEKATKQDLDSQTLTQQPSEEEKGVKKEQDMAAEKTVEGDEKTQKEPKEKARKEERSLMDKIIQKEIELEEEIQTATGKCLSVFPSSGLPSSKNSLDQSEKSKSFKITLLRGPSSKVQLDGKEDQLPSPRVKKWGSFRSKSNLQNE